MGKAEGAAEGAAEGEVRGQAHLLLKLLRIKGFTVAPELALRVESCQDLAQIEVWAERVLVATSLDEVFADPR
jgi:hypothetical protein